MLLWVILAVIGHKVLKWEPGISRTLVEVTGKRNFPPAKKLKFFMGGKTTENNSILGEPQWKFFSLFLATKLPRLLPLRSAQVHSELSRLRDHWLGSQGEFHQKFWWNQYILVEWFSSIKSAFSEGKSVLSECFPSALSAAKSQQHPYNFKALQWLEVMEEPPYTRRSFRDWLRQLYR